jgi:hypothetical protein
LTQPWRLFTGVTSELFGLIIGLWRRSAPEANSSEAGCRHRGPRRADEAALDEAQGVAVVTGRHATTTAAPGTTYALRAATAPSSSLIFSAMSAFSSIEESRHSIERRRPQGEHHGTAMNRRIVPASLALACLVTIGASSPAQAGDWGRLGYGHHHGGSPSRLLGLEAQTLPATMAIGSSPHLGITPLIRCGLTGIRTSKRQPAAVRARSAPNRHAEQPEGT